MTNKSKLDKSQATKEQNEGESWLPELSHLMGSYSDAKNASDEDIVWLYFTAVRSLIRSEVEKGKRERTQEIIDLYGDNYFTSTIGSELGIPKSVSVSLRSTLKSKYLPTNHEQE